MSQFWEQRLDDIGQQLHSMSELTENNVALALRALAERDDKICAEVEEADSRIDALEVHVDDMVITFMATHAPTARDCRLMLAASKISNNLERTADEATKIARRVREMNTEPMLEISREISMVGEVAHEKLRDSITAFLKVDNELLIEVIARDRSVDSIKKQIERDLTRQMEEQPEVILRALHLMTIVRAIERVADHATNIAEEAYYLYNAEDIRHDPSRKSAPAAAKS